MDYISRADFLEGEQNIYCVDCSRRKNSKGRTVYEIGDAPCRACGIGDVLGDLEDFPAADVVEVIRCKDCKYGVRPVLAGQMKCKQDGERWVFFDGYCDFAERRVAPKEE